MEIKKYYSFDEILGEESALVLDNGVFNRLNANGSLSDRLKKVIHLADYAERDSAFELLCEDIRAETKYLESLAGIINKRENIITTREIALELNEYYKIIVSFKEKANGRAGGELQDLEIAVCDTVVACLKYATPRSRLIIGRNGKMFEEYKKWFGVVSESEERERRKKNKEIVASLLKNGKTEEYLRQAAELDRVIDRTNDNNLMSLSLVTAWEQSTILLSGDSRHVGDTLRMLYGYHRNICKDEKIPGLPPQHYRVYIMGREGWRPRVDSKLPPKLIQKYTMA